MFLKLPRLSRSIRSLNNLPRRFFSDPIVSASDAYSLLSSQPHSTFFLDIRDPTSYAQSHIPSALNMNEIFSYLGTSDSVGVQAMVSTFESLFQKVGITGNEKIITYEECLKTRFGSSCRGYFLLSLLGHKKVSVLDGGYEAWLNSGYPVTHEIPTVSKPGTFKANWQQGLYATKDDVLKAVNEQKNRKHPVLLDVRDLDEWYAETSSPYGKDFTPRKGNIPGAIHILWKDFMKTQNGCTFIKDPEEVKTVCKEKDIHKDSEILVYCFKGARASNTLIALKRAGFKNVKNYFASWNEWSRDESLPIETQVKK